MPINNDDIQILNYICDHKGTLIDKSCENELLKITIKCNAGHTWMIFTNTLLKNKSWCFNCLVSFTRTESVREKISETMINYLQTAEGKAMKKASHEKRSITMAEQREHIRSTISEKLCSKCKIIKSVDLFGNKTDTKDGKQPYCRECINIAKAQTRNKQKLLFSLFQ